MLAMPSIVKKTRAQSNDPMLVCNRSQNRAEKAHDTENRNAPNNQIVGLGGRSLHSDA